MIGVWFWQNQDSASYGPNPILPPNSFSSVAHEVNIARLLRRSRPLQRENGCNGPEILADLYTLFHCKGQLNLSLTTFCFRGFEA